MGENAKERRNERQKLARLAGNAWNVRTRSRTAFCVLVSVRIRTYTCARLCRKYCALKKSKRRAAEAILITRVPREVRLR